MGWNESQDMHRIATALERIAKELKKANKIKGKKKD